MDALFIESPELKELAEKIIVKRTELHWLIESDLIPVIGYVQAFEDKKPTRGKVPFATCQKVVGAMKAFCPYEVVITFYPCCDMLDDNQRKVVMLHELKHIGYGKDGIIINPHTTEDFYTILQEFGIDWNKYGNEDVPDILADTYTPSPAERKKKKMIESLEEQVKKEAGALIDEMAKLIKGGNTVTQNVAERYVKKVKGLRSKIKEYESTLETEIVSVQAIMDIALQQAMKLLGGEDVDQGNQEGKGCKGKGKGQQPKTKGKSAKE